MIPSIDHLGDWHLEEDDERFAWRIGISGDVVRRLTDEVRADWLLMKAWNRLHTLRGALFRGDQLIQEAHWRMHPQTWYLLSRLPVFYTVNHVSIGTSVTLPDKLFGLRIVKSTGEGWDSNPWQLELCFEAAS